MSRLAAGVDGDSRVALGSERPSAWLPELDGLRALAALGVIVAHYTPGPYTPSSNTAYGVVQAVDRFSVATTGVVFFYVLSAFLLSYLASREVSTVGSFSRGRFLARRILRIWPLYFALVVVNYATALPTGPLAGAHGHDPTAWPWLLDHIWMYAGFLSNWSIALSSVGGHVDRSTPGLAVLWSIAVEEQFYLLYALVAGVVLKSPRRVALALGAAYIIGLIWRTFFLITISPIQTVPGIYYASVTYIDVFAIGGVAGWLFARQDSLLCRLQALLRYRAVGVCLAAALLVLLEGWGRSYGCAGGLCRIWTYLTAGLLMALSILWVLSNRGAWVSRGVASRPLRGLGALSYGIYVWHPVVMVLVLHDVDPIIVIGQGETDALVNATFIMYILGTLGLAALTYLLIERPFLELKQWLRAGHVSSQPAQRTLGSWIRAYLDIVSVGVVSAIGVVIAALSLQVQFGAATHDRLQALLPIDLTPRAMIAPATEAHFADAPRVSPGVVHADAGIRERRVVPGDVVLLARDGGLVEVQADGTASRLLAKDGETVRVTNLGAWDARRQRLSGLDAVFQTGRWNVPLGDAARATTAWGFTESAANWQREGWSVNPPTVAFTLLHEDGAAFARLTATSGESTIHVRGTRPATRLDGAPLTVRARIRTNRRDVSASLSVHDFVRAGNPNVTIRTLNTSTHWADEILRVGPMHDPHRDDNYSLVVEGLGDGDWVDVAHLSAYIGILP